MTDSPLSPLKAWETFYVIVGLAGGALGVLYSAVVWRRATLLLEFIGIHNAWDTVTFVTLGPGTVSPEPAARSAPDTRSATPREGRTAP